MSLGNIQRLIQLKKLRKADNVKFEEPIPLQKIEWKEFDATPITPSDRIKNLSLADDTKQFESASKWIKKQPDMAVVRGTDNQPSILTTEHIRRSKEGEMLEARNEGSDLSEQLRAALKHRSIHRTKQQTRDYEALARELRGQVVEDYAFTKGYPKKVVSRLRTDARSNKAETEGSRLAKTLLAASREKNMADIALNSDTVKFRETYRQELYDEIQRTDPRQIGDEETKQWLLENIDDVADYGLEAVSRTYSRGIKGISNYQPPKQTTALLGTGQQVLNRLVDDLGSAPEREIQEASAMLGSLIETPLENLGIIKETRRPLREGEKAMHPAQKFTVIREPASAEFFDILEQNNPRDAGIMPSFIKPPVWKKSIQRGKSLIKSYDKDFVKTITQENAKPLFDAVNYLQSTPYTINTKTLRNIESLYQQGKLVTSPLDAGEIQRMSDIQVEMKAMDGLEELTSDQQKHLKDLQDEYASLNARYSKNYDETTTISRGSALASANRPFFYEVSLGDNGRVYFDFPLVNPQGSPIGRGILQLANGETLTPEGVSTMKLEAASYIEDGSNKVKLLTPEERVTYFDQREADFARWGSNPVGTFDEWSNLVDSKNRVAFMNVIQDYADWKANPATFKSHRITSMDATTSGAQIITALLDDDTIASLVNLVPNQKKTGDLYLHAAAATEDIIRANAKAGSNIDNLALETIEKWKETGKERTAFKRPLMIIPYGSGAKTISETIIEDLADKGVNVDPAVARHIADIMDAEMTKIIPALGVFKAIIKRMTSSIFDDIPVEEGKMQTFMPKKPTIRNELGFRYQHNYPHFAPDEPIRITHRDRQISLYPQKQFDDVGGRLKGKAETAFMAKFIHFLDATLLQKLALKMKEKGLPLVPVHDQMGTSPNAANQMLDLIREVMQEMFGGKNKKGKRLLEQMIDEATDADGNLLWDSKDFEDLIQRGNLDIDETIKGARPFDFG